MHRDLKTENILLDEGGRVVICDFGLSERLISFSTKVANFAGTITHMPPELLTGQRVGNTQDVWAAGVILVELLRSDDKLVFTGNN